MARHVWTDKEEAELRRLFEAGHTHSQIARAMGKSHNAVTTKLGRMGLRRPNPTRPLEAADMRVRQRAGKVTLAPLASLHDADA